MAAHEIKFLSKTENLALVEKLIEKVCDEYKVTEDNYGNILVAVTEAVNNAIHHGNKANPNKNVDLHFEEHDHRLIFTIKDEGEGFDYTSLPDPTSPENLEKEHGRGVFLMRHLADEINFHDKGRVVQIVFNISKN